MSNSETQIGEVVSVAGNVITVQLSDSIKSNISMIDGRVYRIGQIGSFLKVPLGYANLYGVVTQIGAAAIPEKLKELSEQNYAALDNRQWLNMVLVGEQLGKKFERGVSQFPTTGDSIHLVTIKDLDVIYGDYDTDNSITVGSISLSESLSAKIDLNKFVSRHSAILGSTGSGKSNSVGVVLKAISDKKFKNSRILVIDPHGEYNSILTDSNVYKIQADLKNGQKELFIPFWALPFEELISIFSGHLNDQNKDYFRDKIVEAKRQAATTNNIKVNEYLITADSPIPFSIKQLWFELDDFERQTFQERAKPETITPKIKDGDAEKLISNEYTPASAGGGAPFLNNNAKGILGFLNSVRIKLSDSRYNFLFSPAKYLPNLEGEIKSDLSILLFSWLGGNEKSVTILDLSGVPSEIMASISGTLLKITYDALFWGQNINVGGKEQPLLIVLEEAHSYLNSGADSIASKSVQSIAKEGRKYGVGLLLVTQRPSELDETVLSQCGTIIALRMNNAKDRGHIRSAIQDELQSMIDLLPSLRTGEAIISGESVKIPSRIQFSKLSNAPKGADPIVVEKWMKDQKGQKRDYKRLVSIWRNQNLKRK